MPDLVPAPLPSGLPEKVSDLDDWKVADLTGWLDENVPVFATMERRTDDARLAIGLVLWKLRDELTEEAFGVEARRLAAAAKVDVGTLRRWRKYAQDRRGLGAPSGAAARSEGQVRARARTSAAKEPAVEATAKQVPNANLLIDLDPVPVASGAQTVPDPAPGGNGAGALSGGPPAELGEGDGNAPQEPSAPDGFTDEDVPDEEELRRRHDDALARSRLSGGIVTDDDAPQEPKPKREPPSPGELVAALLRFKPDRLASIDGPSLRSLLALVRGALEAQAARSKPAAVPGVAACPHPKAKRKSFGYITICEVCGQKV